MLDNESIEIPCSECGKKTKKTIRWLKTNRQMTCRCGTTININADELIRGLRKIEDATRKLEASFKKLGR